MPALPLAAMRNNRPRAVRIAAWTAALLALAAVFAAYLNPHLMVDLANRVWACFLNVHGGPAEPSAWVRRFAQLVRPGGSVLDVACGSGRNLRWLAAQGFGVTGVDRDGEALAPLRDVGLQGGPRGASAEIVAADLESAPWPLPGRRFDAVVVTNYLWRPLWPALLGALADGGVLLVETFADGQQHIGRPRRPEFLLQRGELLRVCAGLRVVAYEDGFEQALSRHVQRIAAVNLAADPASHIDAPPRYGLAGLPG